MGSHTNRELDSLEQWHDFPLVLGGPLFQLLWKAPLEGAHLELMRRRIIAIMLVTWLPLFLLASLGSSASNVGRLCFLYDVEVQGRFLIALPILIAAELIVHLRSTDLETMPK